MNALTEITRHGHTACASERVRIGFLLITVASFFTASTQAQEPACETAGEDSDLTVCERVVPDSRFHEYSVSGKICTGVPKLISLLMNVRAINEWFPDVLEARTLASEPEGEVVYIKNRAPWPLRPRDLVYRFKLEAFDADGSMHVSITGLPEHIAPEAGTVRLRGALGAWKLMPLGHHTEVVFSMHLDLGSVPTFLGNRRVRETVLGAVGNLRSRFPCG